MFLLKYYVAVLFGVIFVHGAINTTTEANRTLSRYDNTTMVAFISNHTKVKRRVLIVKSDDSEQHASLRYKKKKDKGGASGKKKKDTDTLLYQEWNNNNVKVNEFWMYKLDDVVEFFRIYLDTEICMGECDDDR